MTTSSTTTPEISNIAPAGVPTAIGPPSNINFSPDSNGSPQIHNSEYQNSYQWKLPMVAVRPKLERAKSEYQHNNLSRPSSSALNIRSETPAKTPEPPKLIDEIMTSSSNSNNISNYSSNSSTITPANKLVETKPNSKLEPEDFGVAAAKFMQKTAGIPTPRDHNNSWKGSLRAERKESVLASSLDDQTKKIVALEANRLSKKSRSYSMYSLRDQLKTAEAAEELTNPMMSEYKREFVDWKEYGHQVREESIPKRKETDSKLQRRGSWSAPSLPEPLKWLSIGEKNTSSSTKLQPTVTDSKSIRGISYNNGRSFPQRPATSAEFRDYYDDYEFNDKLDSKNRVSQLIEEDRYSERGSQSGSEFDRYSDRGSQFGEHDQYSNHSRNTSYSSQASSLHNKSVTSGLREELLSHPHSSPMHPLPSYIDNLQTRSTYSSNSSVSTPSLPPTPQEYYSNDSRLRKTFVAENAKEDLYLTSSIGYTKSSALKPWNINDDKEHYQNDNHNSPSRNGFYIDDDGDVPPEMNGRFSSKRYSIVQSPSPLDNNRTSSSSSQRGRQLYATPGRSPLASVPRSSGDTSYSSTRSPSPDEYRKYHQRVVSTPSQGYVSRPESRAASVSSHGTSIEEESVVLTDILRAADTDLLKSLSAQMSVFRTAREEVTPKVGAKPATTTTAAKNGTVKMTPKNSTLKTGKSSNPKTTRTAGLPTPGLTSSATKRSSQINGKSPLKNKTSTITNKGHKASSDAREALNRARMQVEQMLDLVSNGSFEL
ncbi:12483_t:CDS:2 [Ambispora leptoticha]|uniref:12483_t:CDS:1 n=1 Tax=Ambispora leptoticha TaxID=144679 RepID=A0A9N9A3R5_9GLOM|nr:12483_t:CDS:2 [Ambispora leptoticha]